MLCMYVRLRMTSRKSKQKVFQVQKYGTLPECKQQQQRVCQRHFQNQPCFFVAAALYQYTTTHIYTSIYIIFKELQYVDLIYYFWGANDYVT